MSTRLDQIQRELVEVEEELEKNLQRVTRLKNFIVRVKRPKIQKWVNIIE